jgi:hypothetical protein
MRPFTAAVFHQRFVFATGVKQGVGQDGKPTGIKSAFRQLAVFVQTLGNAADSPIVPAEDGDRQRG